jgi:hypothetical protein
LNLPLKILGQLSSGPGRGFEGEGSTEDYEGFAATGEKRGYLLQRWARFENASQLFVKMLRLLKWLPEWLPELLNPSKI